MQELNLSGCIAATPEDQNDLACDTVRLFTQTRDFVINRPETWETAQEDIIKSYVGLESNNRGKRMCISAPGVIILEKELSKTIKDVPIGLVMARQAPKVLS